MEVYLNTIKTYLQLPFDLLDDSKSKWFLVLFCAIFSTLFILLYDPLNLSNISQETVVAQALSFKSLGIWGAATIGLTQFVLRPLFHLESFRIWQFLLWLGFEIILLALLFLLIFRALDQPLFSEFLAILRITAMMAIIPYGIACLLISVVKMSQKIKKSIPEPIPSLELLQLKDENGKVMLSTAANRVLLCKSENNYIAVYYWEGDKVGKKLIRTSLKNFQSQLPIAAFIRVHRSYIVNLNNVTSVNRINAELQLQIDHLPEWPIKVSETYKSNFLKRMNP